MTVRAPRGEQWAKRTEWPLAAVAIAFLAAFSVRVLAQPQGHADTALNVLIWTTWAVFAIDYIARLFLATNRTRWFLRHLLDLAVVALPILRPLRLLRLVVLVGALQKAIGGAIRGRVVVYTVFSVVLLVYVASLAILDVERFAPGSKILTFGDAVWWSLTHHHNRRVRRPVTCHGDRSSHRSGPDDRRDQPRRRRDGNRCVVDHPARRRGGQHESSSNHRTHRGAANGHRTAERHTPRRDHAAENGVGRPSVTKRPGRSHNQRFALTRFLERRLHPGNGIGVSMPGSRSTVPAHPQVTCRPLWHNRGIAS